MGERQPATASPHCSGDLTKLSDSQGTGSGLHLLIQGQQSSGELGSIVGPWRAQPVYVCVQQRGLHQARGAPFQWDREDENGLTQ